MASPLASPEPWDLVAKDYDELILPLFQGFSQQALARLDLGSSRRRVLDVACGPGTATELFVKAGHDVDAVDFSPSMIRRLEEKLPSVLAGTTGSARAQVMDGQALSFPDATFDAAVSMFGLMFFPDRARGFSELLRVLLPGARACVSSWPPLSEMPAMHWAFGAFAAITPPPPADAPARQPILEDPAVFAEEMTRAGFRDVRVERCSRPMPITSIEEFWAGMVKSSAPIALFRSRVNDEQWRALNAKALSHLEDNAPKDLTLVKLEAWLAVGEKV